MRALFLFVLLCIIDKSSLAHDPASLYNKIYNLPDRLFKGIETKVKRTQSLLDKQTSKYLDLLAKQEKRLRNKLQKTDPAKAKELFGDIDERYAALRQQFQNKAATLTDYSNVYNGHLDFCKRCFTIC